MSLVVSPCSGPLLNESLTTRQLDWTSGPDLLRETRSPPHVSGVEVVKSMNVPTQTEMAMRNPISQQNGNVRWSLFLMSMVAVVGSLWLGNSRSIASKDLGMLQCLAHDRYPARKKSKRPVPSIAQRMTKKPFASWLTT